ncbi:isopentenyl-diphosphate delta-isomerase [Rozella allomycis CSF55]|uniref:isopentenyl-diphosphate Delta-isomerase n=1 Tax=Rozella allomycis (strain CSF55) TaxID=988480 RepID=A0A075B3P3_ROZAC|nr:NUDIX hydrolase-like domain-containing protein [Rozella allomycis CSF55]RKP21540.1 isopentenyl-diphosphate delta-isomerase [Rozella allomycis CSF55]|eukprot:EPZ35641.1 NUDIX hydrolase-like domain-containing protein [Rozella allomycis CSF55]
MATVYDDNLVTVFQDKENYNVKHPLHGEWTLWYDSPPQKSNNKNWKDNLKKIISFKTVEDFWGSFFHYICSTNHSIYNSIIPPFELIEGTNYHYFREGIEPSWEDPENENGGRWYVNIRKDPRVNEAWVTTVLACVGSLFEHSDNVCGCVITVRQQSRMYRLAIWIKNASDETSVLEIGNTWKKLTVSYFKSIIPRRILSSQVLENSMIDPKQEEYLIREKCILVTEKDEIIGSITKKEAHHLSTPNRLHRAFSVFLFNENDELLLQRRAKEKVTFPLLWTNTCCSHPLYIPEEIDGVEGVKAAAVRKLQHELGITGIKPSDLNFLTRILYEAHDSDGIWGEHEVDYILFGKISSDLKFEINMNEVCETIFVSKDALVMISFFLNLEFHWTPWFVKIAHSFLFEWWGDTSRAPDSEIRKLH